MDSAALKELAGLLTPDQPAVLQQALPTLPQLLASISEPDLYECPTLTVNLAKLLPTQFGGLVLPSIAQLSIHDTQVPRLVDLGLVAMLRDGILANPAVREVMSAILCNLTRISDDACEKFFQFKQYPDAAKASRLYLLKYLAMAEDKAQPGPNIRHLLVNLSRLEAVRLILASEACMPRIMAMLEMKKTEEFAAQLVKNIAFSGKEGGVRAALMRTVPSMMLFLVTPGEFDEDDRKSMPFDVRIAIDSTRTGNHPVSAEALQTTAVEALAGLCHTREGRDVLRGCGIYPLLRELDKATSDEALKAAIETLVNWFMPKEEGDPDAVPVPEPKPGRRAPAVEEIDEDDL
ncbi:protein of unknown function DUF384 [Carpediemonas membranifera]|uniref:Protein HGH1 homolog n=1 Tax=Carpediemonas membranifera TaxID=201153 RepID=A0A8J6BYV9_9EUKA|nr:protein of unknown function DUF384 [Carpediemonas membranifera]|eukprot:KAG9394926.1 protein of unknown function DUF384 [Carpediemonas membranifera]